MGHTLSNDEANHLLNFIGYGRLDAPVWFLGMEEAGGGEDNLRRRLEFETVEDCARAHHLLGIRKHHWGSRVIQPTWRGMCCVMLALKRHPITTENIRTYQAERLGRSDGETLLTELMPIPKPALHRWGYEEVLPQFASREAYYAHVKPRRVRLLTRLLAEHAPQAIIAYGKTYWPDYKALFPDAMFRPVDIFAVARTRRTLVLLTDHFTARSMNGKFDKIAGLIRNDRARVDGEERGDADER